jgi:hypothetical protein
VPRPATYELIERIVGLQLRGATLTELADGVLPRLLEVFASQAGALLLYHSDDRSLTLAASRGLSPAGRTRLEALHPNTAEGWDIPLHGLLNHKAYIIERPHEHPFVPELVPLDIAPRVPNLACLPLYRGQFPVGVLLVIADGPALNETEVLSQVLVYDVLALALDAGLRARGETPGPLDPGEALPALTCEPWTDPRARVQQLEAELGEVARTRDELTARLAALEDEYADAARTIEQYRTTSTHALAGERAAAVEEVTARAQQFQAQLARQLAAAQRELANARAAAERQLADERAAADATVKELQSALVDRDGTYETTVRKLQSAIAERDGLRAVREQELAALRDERDGIERTAREASDAIARSNDELAHLRGERAQIVEAHELALARARALHEHRLADVETAHRQALHETQTASTAAAARATAAEQRGATLERQLASARDEAARRRELHEQILGELEDPTVEPVAAVRGLRETISALETEVTRVTGERTAVERRMAQEVQSGEQRVTAHHRELRQLQVAHEHALAELQAVHQHDVEDSRAVHRQELAQIDEAHRQHAAEQHAEAQQRLADERAAHEGQVAELRADAERRLAALEAARAEAVTRARAAESRARELDGGLRTLHAEVERLHDERAKVVAAVDDPNAEPVAVIKALREQVVGLEGELHAARAERATLEEQVQATRQHHEDRLAQSAAEAAAAVAELKEALAARETTLGERERAMQALDAAAAQARQTAAEAHEVMQRQSSEIERVHGELGAAQTVHAETLARVSAATSRAEALEAELMAVRTDVGRLRDEREQVLAAVEDAGAEPAEVIRGLRQRVEEFEQASAQLEGERAALERRLAEERQAFEEQLTGQQRETDARADTLGRELETLRAGVRELETEAAERATLDERLATVERERADAERERRAYLARVGELERDLSRSEALLETARTELESATRTARAAQATAAAEAAGGARPRPASFAPTRVQVLAPPPALAAAPRTHRVNEPNPALREQIAFALASELPKPPPGGTLVTNLLAAVPSGLAALDEAARAGTLVLAYAADGSGRHRVLGPVRCFAEPPLPAEVVATLARTPGPRRVITLSDDVDALIPTKAALSDAGHSVSMACDPKQAHDILAMFTPDVVLADLRTAPESAADFLDALPLESGLIQVVLVHGDPTGSVLKRVIGRLLRPGALVPSEIVDACRQAIQGPPPPPGRKPGPVRGRPVVPAKPAPRKVGGRRT